MNATSTPNTVQGFELAWNILEGEVDNQEVQEVTETWKVRLPPKHLKNNKALLDLIELASFARQGNISLDYIWNTVVDYKTKWVHDHKHLASWCMDKVTEASAIEDIKTELDLKDVTDTEGVSDIDLELGTKLFSVLHYCPNYVVEASKIAIFYENILEKKSLRTIFQTTMNLMNPDYETENIKTVKAFYKEMDKLFNFTLESALIALTNTEDVRSLLNASLPYLEKHRTILTNCLEEDNCAGVENLIGNIGISLCISYCRTHRVPTYPWLFLLLGQ